MTKLLPIVAVLGAVLTQGAAAPAQTFQSQAGSLKVETVASGLSNPWSIAFLPDGRLLVTERPGRLRIVARDGKLSPPLGGVPRVFASGQGGLLDVMLDRDFAQNRTIYFCYAEPAPNPENSAIPGAFARTAVASAKLGDTSIDNVRRIFAQEGRLSAGNHFGCRIVQTPDRNLFVTLGEHFIPRNEAQNLGNHLGKIIRIKPDGSMPPDNPFAGRNDAKPEIWSYGHRNPQGLAINPVTGVVWEHEHGPRGGDEINIPQAGRNYGWPVIGYGIDYSGLKIHDSTEKPGMEQPVKYWVPSIAPSGMAFYTGDLFPRWKGSLFVGALAGRMLVRLTLDSDKITGEERLLRDLGERIRDVRQGPDGALYLATDSDAGRILRITPAQ